MTQPTHFRAASHATGLLTCKRLRNPGLLFTFLTTALVGFAQTPQASEPPRLQQAPLLDNGQPPFALGQTDAKILVGVNLKAMRESTAGKFIGSQMGNLGSQLPQQAAPMAMFLPLAMQALADIDNILISSPGNLSNSISNSIKDKPTFLVVLDGRFASSPINLMMNGKAEDYRGMKVYHAQALSPAANASKNAPPNDTQFALLNNSRIIFGDAKSLHSALDRTSAPTTVANPGIPLTLRARAASLSQDHDFWIIVQEPLSKLQPGSPNPMLAAATAQIEGLEMGFGLRDGMQFDLNLLAKDENTARMMVQAFAAGLQSGMASPQMNPDQAALLASKVHVSSEGNRLNFSIKLTEEELEQQIRAAQPQRALASAQPNRPAPARPVASRVAAGPKKIKILGLDDGPREIELK